MKLLYAFSSLSALCCILSTAAFPHEDSRQKIDLSTKNFDVKIKGTDKEINKKTYQEKMVDPHEYPTSGDDVTNVKSSPSVQTFNDDPHVMRNNPEPKRYGPESWKVK